MTTQKNGISALGLKRVLGLGSYQTAWAMLHRYRSAMIRPGRERLIGDVEVDESSFGGVRPGKRGRGAAGKALVAIAVEQRSPKGFGRARMQVIADATSETLRKFLLENVEPGAVVISDSLGSYPGACGKDYRHKPFNVVRASGLPAHVPLPGVHRVASLATPSDGSWAHTKARWKATTYRRTSTSSASASTDGTQGHAECSSID